MLFEHLPQAYDAARRSKANDWNEGCNLFGTLPPRQRGPANRYDRTDTMSAHHFASDRPFRAASSLLRPLSVRVVAALAVSVLVSSSAIAQQPATEAALSSGAATLAVTTAGGPAADPVQVPLKSAPTQHTVCSVFRIRPQDDIWVVSTRHLGCPCGYVPTYQLLRYEGGWWLPRPAEQFFAADSPDVVTLFYIHGNRVESHEALSEGLEVYFQLVGKYDAERPVRYVIWSWPTSQIFGPLRDVRAKAARADADAFYLGYFLTHLSPQTPVGLIGFSYGARIITGGLHVLGGGTMLGYGVPAGARPPVRAVLWTAAVHNYWLIPGHYNGNALPMADAWFNAVNPCDRVLARYRFLEKGSNPAALGYTGMAGRNLMPYDWSARFEEWNVGHIIGKRHEMQPYLYSAAIQQRTREYALWYELYRPAPAVTLASAAAQ